MASKLRHTVVTGTARGTASRIPYYQPPLAPDDPARHLSFTPLPDPGSYYSEMEEAGEEHLHQHQHQRMHVPVQGTGTSARSRSLSNLLRPLVTNKTQAKSDLRSLSDQLEQRPQHALRKLLLARSSSTRSKLLPPAITADIL